MRGLRANGIDVVTVEEAGRKGLSDDDHLVFAAAQTRVVYTTNASDFIRLHGESLRAESHHAGIVVLTNQLTSIGTQIRALTRLATTLDAETMADRLEFLSDWIEEAR